MRKDIRNSFLTNIEIDENDRIIYLTFKSKGAERIYGFFWKGRTFYFSKLGPSKKKDRFELFSPASCGMTSKESFSQEHLRQEFDLLGRKNLEQRKGELEIIPIGELLELESQTIEKEMGGPLSKKINSLKKRIKKIKKDLEIEEQLRVIDEYLADDKFIESARELKISRYKLDFKTDKNIFSKKDKLFELRKKIKRAIGIITTRLKMSQQELSELSSGELKIQVSDNFNNNPIWNNKNSLSAKPSKLSSDSHKKIHSEITVNESFRKILLGLNAQGNDHIRKVNKNKRNLWFHLDQRESAHAIVDAESLSELTSQDLEIIGSLLKVNSKLISDEIDMTYSFVKDLKPVKGSSGSVRVLKPRYIRVNYLGNWKDFISTS